MKNKAGVSIAVIKPQELAELSKEVQKIDLIDVRTPVEFREVHVEFARNVPLDQLDPAALMQARNGSANEPLYVICRSGSRGQQACENFKPMIKMFTRSETPSRSKTLFLETRPKCRWPDPPIGKDGSPRTMFLGAPSGIEERREPPSSACST